VGAATDEGGALNAFSRAVTSVALLVAALVLLNLRSAGEAVPLLRPLDDFPTSVGEWQMRGSSLLDTEALQLLKVTDYLVRRYVDAEGRNLWLYVGYWDTQRRGAQIHSPRNCLPGSGWEPVEASVFTIPLGDGRPPLTVNRYVVQKDRDQQLVFYWYQAQGRAVAGEIEARLEMVRNSIVRNRTDGALVRVSSPVEGSVAATSDRLVAYVRALDPLLRAHLPE
jgi:EpsI family protein